MSPTLGDVLPANSYEISVRELARQAAEIAQYAGRMLLVRTFSDVMAAKNIVKDIGLVAPRGDYRWVYLEEMMMDIPPTQYGQRGLGNPTRGLDNYGINGFVQDEIRPTSRLSLNLGVRYEYNLLPKDLATQEKEAIASVPGVIEFRRPAVEKNRWAPRLGLAWDVRGDGRTSVHAAYGLAYNAFFGAYVGGGLPIGGTSMPSGPARCSTSRTVSCSARSGTCRGGRHDRHRHAFYAGAQLLGCSRRLCRERSERERRSGGWHERRATRAVGDEGAVLARDPRGRQTPGGPGFRLLEELTRARGRAPADAVPGRGPVPGALVVQAMAGRAARSAGEP